MPDFDRLARTVSGATGKGLRFGSKRSLQGAEWVDIIVGPRGRLRFHLGRGFQSRNEATAHLFLEALKTIKYDGRGRRFRVHTSDRPPQKTKRGRVAMAYSVRAGTTGVIVVPDFMFWNWPETGVADYSRTVEAMAEAGSTPPSDDRLFWIGSTSTHPNRDRLVELAREDHRIHAVPISWQSRDRSESQAGDSPMATAASNRVTLPDHCRYRYLIDVEGAGYSARLKILLFSGRPLFLQDRPWREFFFDRLEPYRHFIPVKRDLSDLGERLDWAEAHPAECREIAAEALAFARAHLTRDAAIEHLRETVRPFLQ